MMLPSVRSMCSKAISWQQKKNKALKELQGQVKSAVSAQDKGRHKLWLQGTSVSVIYMS